MKETVRDICAEMLKCDADYASGGCQDCRGFNCRDVRAFADRILAAHEREMKQMHDCCDALEDELDAKESEAAR